MPKVKSSSIYFLFGILFSGFVYSSAGACLDKDHGIKTRDSVKEHFRNERLIYIRFAGKKKIKSVDKVIPVIEVINVSSQELASIKKNQVKPKRNNNRSTGQESKNKSSDSIQLFEIVSPEKYKSFYPYGLRTGNFISAKEFNQWNFVRPVREFNRADLTRNLNSYNTSKAKSELSKDKKFWEQNIFKTMIMNDSVQQEFIPGYRSDNPDNEITVRFYPWELDESLTAKTRDNVKFYHLMDSILIKYKKYSGYLGPLRIHLELYNQQDTADLFSGLYMHYTDSIAKVLIKLGIKPGDSEKFISEISKIITTRFPYRANLFLSQGIRDGRLDCDNTAFLVYDVGHKLGINVSLVAVPCHVLAIVGNFAYETTKRKWYPVDELKKNYNKIYMISSDPAILTSSCSLFELSLFFWYRFEHDKKVIILELACRNNPDDPNLLEALGDGYSMLDKQYLAKTCYIMALLFFPDNERLKNAVNHGKSIIVY